MALSAQLARHFREAYFGRNWTVSNLREHLKGVTLEQATQQVQQFNTIATLVFHIHYYTTVLNRVLKGGPLLGTDEDSFVFPPLTDQADWETRLERLWQEAEETALLIEALPDAQLETFFVQEKYGTYYRNIAGTIEHLHYHLGQLVLLKRLLHSSS